MVIKSSSLISALLICAVGGFLVQAQPSVAEKKPKAVDAEANHVDSTIARELKGYWINNLESVLHIKSIDTSTGAISGRYRTKPDAGTPGKWYPLSGWINTAPAGTAKDHVIVISFSVRWGNIGSVTAWNGYYASVQDTPTIVGQWLLSRPNTSFSWDHILTGQDRFHSIPADKVGE